MNNLIQHVKRKKLFTKNETIIVALSGGVDSMVLFDILQKLPYSLQLVIAHVNHKKRVESDAEFQHIKEIAKNLEIPFEGYVLEDEIQGNFQEDARNIRYDFFMAIASKYKAKKIVLAQHLDDQIETILMRLTRGSSFTGYAGMKMVNTIRNVSIVRPLLDVSKDEIYDYQKEHNITYYEDLSNYDDKYTRNRFRNNIIPLLKKENKNFSHKIEQFATYIASADTVLTKLTKTFLSEHCFYNNVSVDAFIKLDYIIQVKVLKHMVNIATNNEVEVTFEQYNNIIAMAVDDTPNQSITLSQGYYVIKEYDALFVQKPEPIVPIEIEVNGFGEYFVDDNTSYVFTDKKLEHNNSHFTILCYNELVFPLYLRQRKNGDKMQLQVGTKKVKDIFIDQKVPRHLRDRIVVLADSEYVRWIPHVKKEKTVENCNNRIYVYEVK